MDRRRFVCTGLLASLAAELACLAGCSDETKQTGGVVETPAEDKKSMEASAAAYRAMEKERAKVK
jgi:hypothetical protein